VLLFVSVVKSSGIFGFKKALGLFGLIVPSVTLVNSFKDVYVFDKLFDVIFVYFIKRSLLVVVKHEEGVFESDGDDFLLVA